MMSLKPLHFLIGLVLILVEKYYKNQDSFVLPVGRTPTGTRPTIVPFIFFASNL